MDSPVFAPAPCGHPGSRHPARLSENLRKQSLGRLGPNESILGRSGKPVAQAGTDPS